MFCLRPASNTGLPRVAVPVCGSSSRTVPVVCTTDRVWASLPSSAPATVRRQLAVRRLTPCHGHGPTEGVSAAGSDLSWAHVAQDVRSRLAGMTGDNPQKLDQLQAWLSEAKLSHTGESDAEHNQTEIVAEEEADRMGLAQMNLDVKAWLAGTGGSPEAGLNARMAGVLVVRLLQAYHKNAGEAFDDEEEDCYWRLQGFVPGALVEALDHAVLKRLIKAYMSMPFSGV